MKGYASNTGTKRNLQALRDHGWAILLTPDNPKRREGLPYGVDNGAWGAHQKGEPFNGPAFEELVGATGQSADFVVMPDIVAGGMASLEFSLSWLDRLSNVRLPLLPLQDGMRIEAVCLALMRTPRMGLFLGGSTEYKLATIRDWGVIAAGLGRYYHVGRVNTMRRIRLAHEAGADSFDGTSATMFSCTLPRLDAATRQPSLLAPEKFTVDI